VRIGFVSRGVTYAVVGGLALALALGAGTDNAKPNQQGALALIARSAIGRIALIVIATGLLAYALWKLEQGIFSRGPEGAGGPELKNRLVNIAGGLVYVGFFLVALPGGLLGNVKTDEMRREPRELFATLGRIGLAARALVFGLIGYFLVRAALDYDPRNAVGVDGALARLHAPPYGSWLVGTVAVGLLAFAAFSLLEARHPRL
jgi:hypothetical protein